jgi:hypothetical protein
MGVPNFWNVVSNLPFVLAGLWGFLQLSKREGLAREWRIIYFFAFTGIFSTGLGSAFYHAFPDSATLVWDRLPMTLIFMPLFAAVIYVSADKRSGFYGMFPLVLLGVFSVLYWAWTEKAGHGDLRLYGVVQFFPLTVIPLLILIFPKDKNFSKRLLQVALWYILAKICEYFDAQIFSAGELMSGHALKHFFAGIASYYIVRSSELETV